MLRHVLAESPASVQVHYQRLRYVGRRVFSSAPVLQRGDGCKSLHVGETYHNFTLERVATVPEYNVDALELRHEPTQANYLHLDAKDPNNVFAVMFRTPPSNSTGVAHILEHTALCGSKRFPVRDPFFNMIKRSLNTYMNALTGADHTMYPFSTTNAKDWHNLMSVYLDAVFFPHLSKLDFLQEGHRLEISEEKGELVYKGVVLNEMKGVLSDSNNLFGTRLQQELMRGTIYEHVSGGDPKDIPSLTYGDLRAFHVRNYHPSNCCFYSYGDLPLTDHLAYLDKEVLNKFEYRADSAAVRVCTENFSMHKKSSNDPELIVIKGPSSNMSGEAADPNIKYCMSKFVDVKSTDPFPTFVLRIVGYLLTNGPASPLFKALIDSSLAQDFSVGTGFDTSTYYPTFGVGVEGIEGGEAAVPAIRVAVHDALEKVVAEGFDKERVTGILHQLELSLKHVTGNFGLQLMHGISSVWAHGGDLIKNLQLNPLLERLNDEMACDPKFLEGYVRDYLMRDDLHEVQMLMLPSEDFVRNQERCEHENLATKLLEQSNADLDRIARTTEQLERHQQKEEPVECLPTLTLDDIPRVEEGNFDHIERTELNSTSAEFVRVPSTNEISYLRFLFDVGALPQEYHRFMNVFTTVFGSLGTSRLAYDELPTVIANCSGGVSCSAMTAPSLTDAHGEPCTQSLLLGTMCLPHKVGETFSLMHELLTDTQFLSDENLRQLRLILQSSASTASSSISSSGAALAGTRSRVGLTPAGVYDELYSGLSQIEQLQKWAQCSDEELRRIAHVLQDIARVVFSPENMRISVVTEDKLRSQVEQSLKSKLLQPLAASSSLPDLASLTLSQEELKFPIVSPKNYFAFPVSVNFVVETQPSVSFAHEDHVPLTVLAQIMSSCYLHQQVREQGGAYGSGVSQNEGSFSMSSHYDPNTFKTLDAYAGARRWAVSGEFSDRDVQEALLSVFASVDAPKTPSMKGRMSFLRGITNDMSQRRREQYLSLNRQDLVDVANKYFGEFSPEKRIVIIGKDGDDLHEFSDSGFNVYRFSPGASPES
ncbi:Peptidase M16C associated [Phytophthora infestans]|uniref:Peptidase M16C associated n=1 Tax=Phytophthora infestans TaxID=4787 RepID=A0A833T1S9_PHYIN|nr:Peptidase M16C associated [Phytophthora infestans]KAF4148226.1 Peptidase M16C associated [Phytophthora infestans]